MNVLRQYTRRAPRLALRVTSSLILACIAGVSLDLSQQVRQLTKESSPLQAVAWFLLGPVLAMPPGVLQSAYASDVLAFILQLHDGAGPEERAALRALSVGESHYLHVLFLSILLLPARMHCKSFCVQASRLWFCTSKNTCALRM